MFRKLSLDRMPIESSGSPNITAVPGSTFVSKTIPPILDGYFVCVEAGGNTCAGRGTGDLTIGTCRMIGTLAAGIIVVLTGVTTVWLMFDTADCLWRPYKYNPPIAMITTS